MNDMKSELEGSKIIRSPGGRMVEARMIEVHWKELATLGWRDTVRDTVGKCL